MPLPNRHVPARIDFVDTVYRVMVDAITDGSLAPGERITQEEIAEQLHVSRSPVLQALRLLKKDGLIEDAPGRGIQVAPLDPAGVGHLYDVRGALDALAARLAARVGAVIDPALIRRGRECSAQGELKAMIDADMAFHQAIYDASGNGLIAQTASPYWMHIRRVMGAVLRGAGHRSTIWEEHEAIAQAIQAREEALAVELSNRHISVAKDNLLHQLRDALARAA
jgi:DNA-binding GntR family transcriptional regulator